MAARIATKGESGLQSEEYPAQGSYRKDEADVDLGESMITGEEVIVVLLRDDIGADEVQRVFVARVTRKAVPA